MKKLFILKLFIVLSILIYTKSVSAQIIKIKDDKGFQFGIGLNVAATRPFTDFNNSLISQQMGVSLVAEPYRFVRFIVEANKGNLRGGVKKFAPIESSTTHFNNSFFSTSAHIQINPFMVVDPEMRNIVLDFISCFYGGAGIGMLYSNVKSRDFLDEAYGSVGTYKGSDHFIALEAGFTIPILKFENGGNLSLNLNYRTNRASTDLIDGYNPPVEANKHFDTYSTYGGGLIIKF